MAEKEGKKRSSRINPEFLPVGDRIRSAREYFGYSRETLAEMADISIQFLGELEGGKKSMTNPVLARLALALKVSTDYLVLGRTADPSGDLMCEVLHNLTPQERAAAEAGLKSAVRVLAAARGRDGKDTPQGGESE